MNVNCIEINLSLSRWLCIDPDQEFCGVCLFWIIWNHWTAGVSFKMIGTKLFHAIFEKSLENTGPLCLALILVK